MADLVIRGGTVVDGTGAPGRAADVAIEGDRITAIGSGLAADRTLDASGCVVAPGFVDIHTHYDAQVFWDPALTPSCFHGVTTVVAGNCGFSIAPTRPDHRDVIARTLENVEDMDPATLAAGIPWDFETHPEYLASVSKHGSALNFGAYVGHTAVRLYVMGDAAYERKATEDEIARMCQVVREAMEAGAVGLATSFAPTHLGIDGKPVPSRFAELAEFEAMARVLAELGRGVVAVTPGQGFFKEMYDFQRRVGVPMTYTALLAMPGFWQMGSKLNDEETAKGADVWPQVSCRKLTMQLRMSDPFQFNQAASFAALMGKPREARVEAYRDPTWRERALAELDRTALPPRWQSIEVAETERHTALVDRRVAELAGERGVTPFDVMLDLSLEEGLATRFRCVQSNDDEEGIAHLLRSKHVVLGLSDAGAHVGQLCDAPLPTDLLGNWVRERGVLPLEEAVRKLTSEPAALFRFTDRGVLRPGACADVAVFDPDTVAPGPLRRVRDFPADGDRLTADAPAGMRHVVVNGVPIREEGEARLDARPGRLVAQGPFG
ncbi:MAG: amidohydrolase family protein [Myxococcota bacterium]